MKKVVLITRPNHDPVLNYLYYWTSSVVELAETKKYSTFDLKAERSNRELLNSYTRKHNPSFIFFNGHGNSNSILGHDNKVLVDTGKSITLLKGRIIYSRTCDSASKLGMKSTSIGTIAFIGYIRPFVFAYNRNYVSKPLNDKLAKIFLEPSNLVATTILKGHPVKEAHRRSREAMRKNLFRILSSEASLEERVLASHLWNNITNQKLIGNSGAKI